MSFVARSDAVFALRQDLTTQGGHLAPIVHNCVTKGAGIHVAVVGLCAGIGLCVGSCRGSFVTRR